MRPAAALLPLLLACAPLAASAQGLYLSRGQNGLWLNGGFTTNERTSGLGVTGGVSANGLLDLGVEYARLTPKDELFPAGDRISPTVTVYPIKEDRETPFSLGIRAAYHRIRYERDPASSLVTQDSGSGYTVGAFVHGLIDASAGAWFAPHAGIAYENIEYDPPGIRETTDALLFPIGLAVAVDLTEGNYFVLDPTLVVGDGPTTFGVTAGFVMGFGGRYRRR